MNRIKIYLMYKWNRIKMGLRKIPKSIETYKVLYVVATYFFLWKQYIKVAIYFTIAFIFALILEDYIRGDFMHWYREQYKKKIEVRKDVEESDTKGQ